MVFYRIQALIRKEWKALIGDKRLLWGIFYSFFFLIVAIVSTGKYSLTAVKAKAHYSPESVADALFLVHLTLPKFRQGKNLPLVVNPHGGPEARNVWGYSPEAQFLANRGYAVLQMNFRGSTGYGKKFWMAGFKQWGGKMQDDITDGVRYLIKKGIVNKNKVAVYGSSYGGYAALAGLAFTPDLYACGASFVGVSNIFTLLNSIPPYWEPQRKIMYEKIGHPEKDKELLKRISPLFHIDKIKAPLFIAHGAEDPRVKQAESDQIVKALEAEGIKVPYLIKANEGHGFSKEENRMDFYRLLEVFLEDCLN